MIKDKILCASTIMKLTIWRSLGTNDYLAWLAMEKQRINAIRLAYIRDKISKGTYEDAL